jgi:hypothetical protein
MATKKKRSTKKAPQKARVKRKNPASEEPRVFNTVNHFGEDPDTRLSLAAAAKSLD